MKGENAIVKEKEFFIRLATIFDVSEDTVDLNYKVPEDTLDSIAILSITAAIDEFFNIMVSVKDIEKITTVGDLMKLIAKEADNE